MGARLARYTQNDSYAVRAEKAWDWLWGVQFIDHQTWAVYDGANVKENCSNVVKPQYSYNAARRCLYVQLCMCASIPTPAPLPKYFHRFGL